MAFPRFPAYRERLFHPAHKDSPARPRQAEIVLEHPPPRLRVGPTWRQERGRAASAANSARPTLAITGGANETQQLPSGQRPGGLGGHLGRGVLRSVALGRIPPRKLYSGSTTRIRAAAARWRRCISARGPRPAGRTHVVYLSAADAQEFLYEHHRTYVRYDPGTGNKTKATVRWSSASPLSNLVPLHDVLREHSQYSRLVTPY